MVKFAYNDRMTKNDISSMALPLQVDSTKVMQYLILWYIFIGKYDSTIIIKEKTALTNT